MTRTKYENIGWASPLFVPVSKGVCVCVCVCIAGRRDGGGGVGDCMRYLYSDVQGINYLPDHKGRDVDDQQNANGGVELPWIQVLQGEERSRQGEERTGGWGTITLQPYHHTVRAHTHLHVLYCIYTPTHK